MLAPFVSDQVDAVNELERSALHLAAIGGHWYASVCLHMHVGLSLREPTVDARGCDS